MGTFAISIHIATTLLPFNNPLTHRHLITTLHNTPSPTFLTTTLYSIEHTAAELIESETLIYYCSTAVE